MTQLFVCLVSTLLTVLWSFKVHLTQPQKNTHYAPNSLVFAIIWSIWQRRQAMRRRVIFIHRGFSSDEGNFLSNKKLFPVISWVELNCKRLKLVSSVSEGLVWSISSRDWWEEVSRGGSLIVTKGVLIDDTAGYDPLERKVLNKVGIRRET